MGQGGVGRRGVGGMGGGKNHPLGHPMSSHDAHTVANNTPVGHTSSESKYRSHCPIGALHGSHCFSGDSGDSDSVQTMWFLLRHLHIANVCQK